MAWTNSKIFRAFLETKFKNTSAYDLDGDSFKAALYDNDITPDNDCTQANSAYGGAGVWTATGDQTGTAGSQIYHTGQWAQGGVALGTLSVDAGTADTVFWDAADTASGSAATMSNIYGCLTYDTTVSSYGITYNYFGGAQQVTTGTFTIVWHTNGIFRITL